MDLGDFGRNFKRGAGSSSSPQGSLFKKQVADPGAVQVEIKCDRYAVSARWQFGAERLKTDLLRVRVPGWSNGLMWNVASRSYMNADRNSAPSAMKLTCPSPEFLKELCRACEASDWCTHWYITSRTQLQKMFPCRPKSSYPPGPSLLCRLKPPLLCKPKHSLSAGSNLLYKLQPSFYEGPTETRCSLS